MSKEYLNPDFDPNNSTVVQLKSILSENDIHMGHNPKKAELVETFNEKIKPKVEEIKAKLEEAGDDDYFNGNGQINGAAGNSSPRSSSSRRSSVKTRSQAARERSMTPSGYSDDEDVKPKASPLRNNRTTMLEPSSSRKPHTSAKKDIEDINPENPFQSYRNKSTTGSASKTTPSKSTNKFKASVEKSASKPINETNSTLNGEAHASEKNGEAFTAEQNTNNQPSTEDESSQHAEPRRSARLQNISSNKSPHGTPGQQDENATNTASSRKGRSPNQQEQDIEDQEAGTKYRKVWSIIKSILFYIFVTVSLALIVFNQYQSFKLSFSNDPESTAKRSSPNFWGSGPLQCPPHANCVDGKFIECQPGYKLKEGLFSRQYIPFLYPKCIPHNFETISVELISKEIVKFLSEYRTKVTCDDFDGPNEVPLEALHKYISIRFQIHPDENYFTPIFNKAIEDVAQNQGKSIILYNKSKDVLEATNPDLLTEADSIFLTNPSYPITCLIKETFNRFSTYFSDIAEQLKATKATDTA